MLNFALSGIGGSAKSLLRLQLVVADLSQPVHWRARSGDALRFLFYGYSPALLILTVFFGLFSVLLLFLGLIGDQVRLLAERLRNVPLVIEEERLNFPPEREQPVVRTVPSERRSIRA